MNCFLPISVGGGIRFFKDAVNLFKQGADKIVLNSSTYKNPDLIEKISKVFGSQSIIHSIDCRKVKKNKVFTSIGLVFGIFLILNLLLSNFFNFKII